MTTGLARIDLRLQRLEETICPVDCTDELNEICEKIVLKTAEDVIDFDSKLFSRDYRKKLVILIYIFY